MAYDMTEQEFVDEALDLLQTEEDVAAIIKDFSLRLSMKKCESQAEWYV